jgi:pyruvate formate lyase activating enzyme
VETCGTVDGPGVRTVIFLQGCRLACRFCHNPDTWNRCAGKLVTVEDLLDEVIVYRAFHESSGGGVTLSGGDPLAQPEFAQALLVALSMLGVHSALDTSGGRPIEIVRPVVDAADLVLLDIKHSDADQHLWLTGVPMHHSIATGDHLASTDKPTWIRHVVIPGITDSDDHFNRFAQLVSRWPNVKRIDLLPYHTMHLEKWTALGLANPLAGTPSAGPELINRARKILADRGLPVDRCNSA